ncbi:deoxyribodipyrimidine photolyase [Desulfosarcina variabilis str. Montpellier]|uniref:cryptochrome/photolyase family protein n=1 Tax=Desulfosarcina variabilis TaxID=2300 RepID=UPI003AFA2EC9
MKNVATLRLILGDQLNTQHSWFKQVRADVLYTLMEVRQETDVVKPHIQKVAGFFSAMRHFADDLVRMGHRVVYLRLDDPKNEQAFEANLNRLIREHRIARFEYMLPDDYQLDRKLARLAAHLSISSAVTDTEHFLTERGDVARHFQGKKRYLMESFYRQMRRRHDILMDGGKPAGGKWNYDQSNRQRYDGAVTLPETCLFSNDVSDIVAMLDRCQVPTFGRVGPKRLIWPVTRKQALQQLQAFVDQRLPYFGTYQDAMTTESAFLFHSLLSFALNTKMLHPLEVIQTAMDRSRSTSGEAVGIAQLEGFIRQILGWREYMRGIYWAHMPAYASMNHFGHSARLPDYYWTSDTRMNCLRSVISQSLEHAYAHHIQRLMITGNFALLAGIDPDEVDGWYLGIYIDAIQWVEIVNTRGMSQYADGGLVATKPYISSANYIHKMSDYCEACHYHWQKPVGERACPFNSFYWAFVHRHRQLLSGNPRIAMMLRNWDRMKTRKQDDLLAQAEHYRAVLNTL